MLINFETENKECENAEIWFWGYSHVIDGSVMDTSAEDDLLKREICHAICPDLKTANAVIEQSAFSGVFDLRLFEVV